MMKLTPTTILSTILLVLSFSLFAQDLSYSSPDLIFIEGGTFNMGQGAKKDIVRRVTVSSFYIDATEVTNKQYRTYLTWTKTHQPDVALGELMPDTTIWAQHINDKTASLLTNEYFRIAAFDHYPVLGVTWKQAKRFLEWKSDRTNEKIAIEEGDWTPEMQKKFVFCTKDFLSGNYLSNQETVASNQKSYFFPSHRLPSEAEWEFAAWGLINNTDSKQQTFEYASTLNAKVKKHQLAFVNKYRKEVLKHTKKNPVPAYYNHDKYLLPQNVFEGEVNRYGIYNMNDNASEWVADSYRPITKPLSVQPKTQPNNHQLDLETVEEGQINGIKDPTYRAPSKITNTTQARVYKGANVATPQKDIIPSNRSGQKATEQQNTLLGFRAAMTRVQPPNRGKIYYKN